MLSERRRLCSGHRPRLFCTPPMRVGRKGRRAPTERLFRDPLCPTRSRTGCSQHGKNTGCSQHGKNEGSRGVPDVAGQGGQPPAVPRRRHQVCHREPSRLSVPSGFPGAEIRFTAYGEQQPSLASWSSAGRVPLRVTCLTAVHASCGPIKSGAGDESATINSRSRVCAADRKSYGTSV